MINFNTTTQVIELFLQHAKLYFSCVESYEQDLYINSSTYVSWVSLNFSFEDNCILLEGVKTKTLFIIWSLESFDGTTVRVHDEFVTSTDRRGFSNFSVSLISKEAVPIQYILLLSYTWLHQTPAVKATVLFREPIKG